MPNVDSPFGFVPIGTTDGADYHGKMQDVNILAANSDAMFIGDMVTRDATDNAESVAQKSPSVELIIVTTAPADIMGALSEFYPDFLDEGSLITNYRLASTSRSARIIQGSSVIYECQANDDATLDGADIGNTYDVDLATAAGDTITGTSGQQLDSNLQTTNQFLLRGFSEQIGNIVGDDFPIVQVTINSAEGAIL